MIGMPPLGNMPERSLERRAFERMQKGNKNMLNILQKVFSVRNKDSHKIITICGIKFKLYSHRLKCRLIESHVNEHSNVQKRMSSDIKNLWEQIYIIHNQINGKFYEIDNDFIALYIRLNALRADDTFDLKPIFDKKIRPLNIEYLSSDTGYIDYLFPKLEGTFDNKIEVEKNPNFFYMGGIYPSCEHTRILSEALKEMKKYTYLKIVFLGVYFHMFMMWRISIKNRLDIQLMILHII